jgi:SAM-dependent methyltransferase
MLWLGVGLAVFWSLGSILITFYVYDLSPLYEWRWLAGMLKSAPQAWVNFHAGLDETSEAIRTLFPASHGRTLDIYEAGNMTEHSIARARRSANGVLRNETADFGALPIMDSECDAAFLVFSAHEIRDPAGRLRFFKELRRILKPSGRLVLVEHVRDVWNFVAYGPGFLHFYSRAEWTRLASDAGLSVEAERFLTPFVRCFVFAREANK